MPKCGSLSLGAVTCKYQLPTHAASACTTACKKDQPWQCDFLPACLDTHGCHLTHLVCCTAEEHLTEAAVPLGRTVSGPPAGTAQQTWRQQQMQTVAGRYSRTGLSLEPLGSSSSRPYSEEQPYSSSRQQQRDPSSMQEYSRQGPSRLGMDPYNVGSRGRHTLGPSDSQHLLSFDPTIFRPGFDVGHSSDQQQQAPAPSQMPQFSPAPGLLVKRGGSLPSRLALPPQSAYHESTSELEGSPTQQQPRSTAAPPGPPPSTSSRTHPQWPSAMTNRAVTSGLTGLSPGLYRSCPRFSATAQAGRRQDLSDWGEMGGGQDKNLEDELLAWVQSELEMQPSQPALRNQPHGLDDPMAVDTPPGAAASANVVTVTTTERTVTATSVDAPDSSTMSAMSASLQRSTAHLRAWPPPQQSLLSRNTLGMTEGGYEQPGSLLGPRPPTVAGSSSSRALYAAQGRLAPPQRTSADVEAHLESFRQHLQELRQQQRGQPSLKETDQPWSGMQQTQQRVARQRQVTAYQQQQEQEQHWGLQETQWQGQRVEQHQQQQFKGQYNTGYEQDEGKLSDDAQQQQSASQHSRHTDSPDIYQAQRLLQQQSPSMRQLQQQQPPPLLQGDLRQQIFGLVQAPPQRRAVQRALPSLLQAMGPQQPPYPSVVVEEVETSSSAQATEQQDPSPWGPAHEPQHVGGAASPTASHTPGGGGGGVDADIHPADAALAEHTSTAAAYQPYDAAQHNAGAHGR